MDTKRILAELHAERSRIERAISAIEAIQSDGTSRTTSGGTARRRRGRMSPAARKRLSELMKKRWASGKMKGRSKAA